MITNLRFQFFAVLLIFIGFTFSVNAQTAPPSNLSGSALRTWYKQNYHDGKHNTLGYSTARKYMYNYIDNKNNTITGVYSGFVQPWTYGGTGTNPAPINCEHTVPQSFFGKADPMVSDIHHLFPTYGSWNSTRSNYPFAEINDSQTEKWMVNSSQQTSIPSSNIDAYSEYASQTFEPREDQKGNTARAIFYFYTMYPTQAGSMSQVGDINVLYQWHLQDPVDADEIDRNNKIEQYQGDRNPYIDYPQTVAIAWNLSGGTGTGGGTGGGTTPTPTGSELFISEYIEGSSNNKGLEIYNPTSSSVSLSAYSIQKQTNGAGNWNSNLGLSGTLAAGQTYVIVYSSASTTLKNKADLVTSSSAVTFNGNDAVALFKNGSLIDVVGVFNSSATFGANVTLVRKPTVTTGNTTYTVSEWTSYSQDTFTYAGNHTVTGGTTGGSTAAPSNYCASKGNSVADEWIQRVTFGSINNTSGSNGGYKDYTNLSTTVSKGSNQTITIYPAWSRTVYNEAYRVFIDWNRDGDFNDANETVFSRSATNATSVSGTISVPATASTGTTRMRVSMKYNANSTSCETFSYGEVEDYHITITGNSKITVGNPNNNNNDNKKEETTIQNTVNQFKIFPNPTSQDTKLQVSVIESQNVVVRMFDAQGKEVSFQTVFVNGNEEITLPTNRLKTGLYIVEITGKDFRFTHRVVKN
ncbi:MAG: hypothetical protein COZ18_05320 [Flexibacter sp. CG_4_10_14_3_um_filter_32_15]|nr:MAG: hypothetical protein COZ18_05320 [Flexibacter sp. CG_4_10_14_3_um_filter_32_15]